MAQFEPALEKTLSAEGGFWLTRIKGDVGGETYAGISRVENPGWYGWALVDADKLDEAKPAVEVFYRARYWYAIRGDEIVSQALAEDLFDTAVNLGTKEAILLAQTAIGATADGELGVITLAGLNHILPSEFSLKFALLKIRHYAEICNKNRAQTVFLLGWVNRTLEKLKGYS